MTRLTVVGLVLLFGILIGLTHEPDSGTAASVGPRDIAEATVGANYAKPLPRIPSVADLLALWQVFAPAVLALVLLIGPVRVQIVRVERDGDRHRSVFRSPARARRGPPALV